MSNPNTNILEGYQCPECQSFGSFQITISTTATVTDDECEVDGDKEWDGSSHCVCNDCGHQGKVSEFSDVPEQPVISVESIAEKMLINMGDVFYDFDPEVESDPNELARDAIIDTLKTELPLYFSPEENSTN